MKYYWLLIICLCSCYSDEELPDDQTVWKYDLPTKNQLDQSLLLNLNALIKEEQFQLIEGLIIIRNDKLVFEDYYFNDANRDYVKNIGSAGLTITLAALGVAEDRGFLSLSDPIDQYLPEYSAIFEDDPDKRNITIEQLLLHRTGLSWNETIKGYFSSENNLNQMKTSDDWVAFVLNQPLEAPPGIRYSFNTANGLIVSKIIENASNTDYLEFLNQELLTPLSISSLNVQRDPNGSYNGGDGYNLSLLDWTKLGYLYLKEGIWKGRRIIDPNFVEGAFSNQFQISESQGIGYYWNLFGDNFENAFAIEHEGIIYSFGELGQSLFIVPTENMVVAIMADNFFQFNNLSLNLFAEITTSIQQ